MGQGYFNKRKKFKRFATVFLFLLWGYLSFHLFMSERSVTSLMSLSAQNTIIEQQLAKITAERDMIEGKVVRLRPQSLDMDLLDEQAMIMLGRVDGDSVVIVDDKS